MHGQGYRIKILHLPYPPLFDGLAFPLFGTVEAYFDRNRHRECCCGSAMQYQINELL